MSAKEIKSKQEALLADESKEMNDDMYSRFQCMICNEAKKKLYLCTFEGCKQANRIMCKSCGKATHRTQKSDDSSDEDEEDEPVQLCDHSFDTKQSYIQKIDKPTFELKLSAHDKLKIQEQANAMNRIVQKMKSKRQDSNRTAFELSASGMINAVLLYDDVINYVANPVYWSKWGSGLLQVMRNGEIKESVTKISSALFGIGDRAFEYTNVCKEGAFTSGAIVFALETAYHTYHLCRGNISLKQYKQKVATAAAVTTAGMVGNIGGAAVGAVIGTYLCPFVGTAFCSAFGALLGGIWGGWQAKKSMDSMFEDEKETEEENLKMELFREALIAFGFDEDDVSDKEIFNAGTISKEYRRMAKKAHPDCRGGSAHKFLVLTSRMTMLLSMVDQNNSIKKETVKKIKALKM